MNYNTHRSVSEIDISTGNTGDNGNGIEKQEILGRSPLSREKSRPATSATAPHQNGAKLAVSDPFAPLTGDELVASATAERPGKRSNTVLPIPLSGETVAPETFQIGKRKPLGLWLYRNAGGQITSAVARYPEKPNGVKDIIQFCHGQLVNGDGAEGVGWHKKAHPTPRPLYGLDRLAARPDAPVLVVEGEKTADAAAEVFPNHVVVTTACGSKAAATSDFTPLAGRDVTLWPDNDDPGLAYAKDVRKAALAVGAASFRVVDVPADWPKSWDLADTPPDGVEATELADLLTAAPGNKDSDAPYDTRSADPGGAPRFNRAGFDMVLGGASRFSRGLFYQPPPNKKGEYVPATRVCDPFEILAKAYDGDGRRPGVQIEWTDHRGRRRTHVVAESALHRPGNQTAEELTDAGLSCETNMRAHELLKRYFSHAQSSREVTLVEGIGWANSTAFVLPGAGPDDIGFGAGGFAVRGDKSRIEAAYAQSGTLAEWNERLASPAMGNDRLVFAICVALAGPLLAIMGEQSGGVHLVGASRTGKSTALALGASVWGSPAPNAQIRQWRGTANGIEEAAAETSDTVLILDEMGQVSGREVGEIVYLISNEGGKQRANKDGGLRVTKKWRCVLLSSGEITLDAKMAEAGLKPTAGLGVRLVNVPADAGADLGVFQNLHGRAGPGKLAEELTAAARKYHGTAARAFLSRLVKDRADHGAQLSASLAKYRDDFIQANVSHGANSQVRSVAGRFGMFAAAGNLAAIYSVVAWPENAAWLAAAACFRAWLSDRGGVWAGEDLAMVEQIRLFFQEYGDSRFVDLIEDNNGRLGFVDEDRHPPIKRAGYRRYVIDDDGERVRQYMVLPVVWRNEICRGLNSKRALTLMREIGALSGGDLGRQATNVRVPDDKTQRVYLISVAALGALSNAPD